MSQRTYPYTLPGPLWHLLLGVFLLGLSAGLFAVLVALHYGWVA